LSNIDSHEFHPAKLGRQDDFSFPDLLPGSIVRVKPNLNSRWPVRATSEISDLFGLIEPKGFCCCRPQPIGKYRIIRASTQLPDAQIELWIPEDLTILGVVIRPLTKPERPGGSARLGQALETGGTTTVGNEAPPLAPSTQDRSRIVVPRGLGTDTPGIEDSPAVANEDTATRVGSFLPTRRRRASRSRFGGAS
jgi:hypothetical protein